MSDRWRLGLIERSVLEAMDELGARPDRQHMKCARIVQFLADERDITPRYSFDALCTLSQPWLLHIPLVDFHGNNGSADYPPAPAAFTEARLSQAGRAMLAAERGNGPLVPVTLINGALHADGLAPPFSPTRVTDALVALIDNPTMSDGEVIERVGPPASPTGCGAACDFRALAAGESTSLVWTAHLHQEGVDRQPAVVVSNLPLSVGEDRAVESIAARVEAMHVGDPEWDPCDFDGYMWTPQERTFLIPLKDVRNESWGSGWGDQTRIVCIPRVGAELDHCEQQVASTWGVKVERQVRLAAPLAQLLRDLVDPDRASQLAALASLRDQSRSA